MARQKTKYAVAVDSMGKGKWFTLEELFEHVWNTVDITDEELLPSKKDNPMPVWKHRIYSCLNHYTLRGQALHIKTVSKKNSVTGKTIPAVYKLI